MNAKYEVNSVLVSNRENCNAVISVKGMVLSCGGLFGFLRGQFEVKRYILDTAIGIIEEDVEYVNEAFDLVGAI